MKRPFIFPLALFALGLLVGVGASYLAGTLGPGRALSRTPRSPVPEAPAAAAPESPAGKLTPPQQVTGIGGIFFKAHDPKRMAAWYRDHLGVQNRGGHADFLWRVHDRPEEIGHTAWALFPEKTTYFGPDSKPFMIDYRVDDLDRMLEQLRSAGVTVSPVDASAYGRFAWISDPEGNRIELWQPPAR